MRLTPAELMEMRDAYDYRIELEMQRLAWHAANVMNVHLKRPVTVKKLLGKDKKAQTFAEKESQFEELMKRLNGILP